ncbi:hypothetical protein Hanom_Chr17g01533871 [Helianthus anomalus]
MPVDVVVLWQEAAEGKVWGQGVVTEENMAATRELGNNKRTWQQ